MTDAVAISRSGRILRDATGAGGENTVLLRRGAKSSGEIAGNQSVCPVRGIAHELLGNNSIQECRAAGDSALDTMRLLQSIAC
jgi:hypothetical protein